MSPADTPALNRSREVPASTQSGYVMLLVSLALVGVAAWMFFSAMAAEGPPSGMSLLGAALTGFIGLFILTGF